MTEVQKKLFSLRDEEYREFNSGLIPTVDKARIIGVRIPEVRKYAKELYRNGQGREFIKNLPHEYFEEDNLHAFILEQFTDIDELISELDKFLPFVDNWATCDSMNPKLFKKYPEIVKKNAIRWINSDDTYAIRYGILLLMKHFLDDNFSCEIADIVAEIKSEEYYVNMMTAWFFATALSKQYDSILPYIMEYRLSEWCHNKAIQKATESNCIAPEQKTELRQYKKTPTH